jgi:hypothetical protein
MPTRHAVCRGGIAFSPSGGRPPPPRVRVVRPSPCNPPVPGRAPGAPPTSDAGPERTDQRRALTGPANASANDGRPTRKFRSRQARSTTGGAGSLERRLFREREGARASCGLRAGHRVPVRWKPFRTSTLPSHNERGGRSLNRPHASRKPLPGASASDVGSRKPGPGALAPDVGRTLRVRRCAAARCAGPKHLHARSAHAAPA